MKLIIDIPIKEYEFIKDLRTLIIGRRTGKTIEYNVITAIQNGVKYEERAKGKWIPDGTWYADENGVYDFKMYRCSLCKRVILTAISKPTILFPYCHCGAEMSEADNDT